jgi:hypothetical protein
MNLFVEIAKRCEVLQLIAFDRNAYKKHIYHEELESITVLTLDN